MNINSMIVTVKILAVILLTIIVAQHSIKLSLSLLSEAGCALKNYRGNEVVFGMGIAFLPILLTTTALLFFVDRKLFSVYIPYLFAVCSIGFAALLDDLIGNKQIKGLKNHILSFYRGQLTTGFIKAFVGLASSFVISLVISVRLFDFILNMLIIALFTNALNLMDLRPGRCIKVFLLLGFAILIINIKDIIIMLPLIVMAASAIIYLKYDLKELCMLGDTGSNILGITLGYYSALTFDSLSKLIILTALFSLNLAAEKISISKTIANNRFLNFLDNLGRSS